MDNADSTYYYNLAIRYFNGELGYSDEEVLFQFVKSSSDNEVLFHRWEKEWFSSSEVSSDVDKEWELLKQRMTVRRTFVDKRRKLHPWFRIAAAVVGGLIVLIAGYTGFHYYQPQISSENLFTLETGRAEKTRLLLADGTIVYLNARSSLRYGDDFNKGHREVSLSGEAYFEVAKQEGNVPFVVKTDVYDVVVKGTKFNVSVYPEDDKASTVLLNGSVDIMYKDKHIPVSPGELVSLNKTSYLFSREKVQAEQYKSWTEGRFEYDKISLQELADRLSRRYDVTIHLDEAIQKDVVFRISLRNEETIDDILQALAQIVPIRYKKQEREVRIWKK